MMRNMRMALLGLVVGAMACLGQGLPSHVETDAMQWYTGSCTVTASNSAPSCTLSVPGGTPKRTFLSQVMVTTPTAVNVDFKWGAIKPSSTPLPSVKSDNGAPVADSAAKVYDTGGTGSPILTVQVASPGGAPTAFGMKPNVFPSGDSQSRTLEVTPSAPISGVFTVVFMWGQR